MPLTRWQCAAVALGTGVAPLALACTPGHDAACAASVLEEVVVTGRRVPRIVLDASETISVVTAEQLQRSTAYGLADLMRDIPGIQVTDSGQPGLKRVRIRGEESRRTAILVDGQEITDHWEVGTPLSLNPSMVERIEVVRGSGSVLYGPRALSGVVNFITRKGGSEALQFEASSGWNSATRGQDRFASVFGNLDGLEYRLAVADSEHGKRDTPQGKIDDTAFDNRSVYAWAGRQFGSQRLELGYDRYESSTAVFVEEDVRTSFPLLDFRIDVPQRDREKLALVYEWTGVASFLPVIRATVHRQWNERQFDTFSTTLLPGPRPLRTDRSIFSDAGLEVSDAMLQFDWTPWPNHYVVSGLQYTDERVNQERHVDTLNNGVGARPEDVHEEASIETFALFAQDEWQLGDHTTLTTGARQYRVEGALDRSNRAGLSPSTDADARLVASVGLSHALREDLVLRASAAQGYVYPSLLQFATGAYAASRYVNPNPALEPETSVSFEAGLRLRRHGWVFDAGVFRSAAEEYIDHVFCTPADGCLSSRDKIYRNIGESVAQGLELYTSLAEGDTRWRPYASLTWMQRENRYENFVTTDSGTPGLGGTLGLLYEREPADGAGYWFDFALRGESASRREEPASNGLATIDEDDSWVTLNLAGGVRLGQSRRVSLVLELENLADQSYSTSAENLLAPGRSVSARLGVALD